MRVGRTFYRGLDTLTVHPWPVIGVAKLKAWRHGTKA